MSVSTEYYSMVSIELNVELWTSIIDEWVDYSSVEPVLNTYFWKSDLMSDAEIRRVQKKNQTDPRKGFIKCIGRNKK